MAVRLVFRPCIHLLALLPMVLAAQTRAAQPRAINGAALAPGGPPVFGLRVQPTLTTLVVRWHCPAGALGFEVFATPRGGAPVKLTATPVSGQCVQDLALGVPNLDPRYPVGSQPTYSADYTHGGLAPATEFTYLVRALYPGGGPADSDLITARTNQWPAPLDVKAHVWERQGTVTWEGVWGAPGHLVFRKLATEIAFRQIGSLPHSYVRNPSYYDNELPLGRHEYFVQAVDGEPSAPASAYAGRPHLSQIPTHMGSPRFKIAWSTAYPGATYRVLASASPTGPYADVTLSGVLAGTSWDTQSGSVGATVYYRILATYPTIAMESEPVGVTIPPPPVGPTNLKIAVENGLAKLAWTCDHLAIHYNVYRRLPGGYPEQVGTAAGGSVGEYSGCSFSDKLPDPPAKVYEYTLLAAYPFNAERPRKKDFTGSVDVEIQAPPAIAIVVVE